jgi:hypothetical protein
VKYCLRSPFRARLAICLSRRACQVFGLSPPNPKARRRSVNVHSNCAVPAILASTNIRGPSKFRCPRSLFVRTFVTRRFPLSTLATRSVSGTFVHWHLSVTPLSCTSTLSGSCASSLSTPAICASSTCTLTLCSLSLSICSLPASTLPATVQNSNQKGLLLGQELLL